MENIEKLFEKALEKKFEKLFLYNINYLRVGKIINVSNQQRIDIIVESSNSTYLNVKLPRGINEVKIGDRCLLASPDPKLPEKVFIVSINSESTEDSTISGSTLYTTTYTGIQGVTGGGDFTANRQFAFFGNGVTITNSILTGNSLGLNINTGGSYLSPYITSPIITGACITSSSITGSSFGSPTITTPNIINPYVTGASIVSSSMSGSSMQDTYLTSVEITGSSLFTNSITGSSISNSNLFGVSISSSILTNNTLNGSSIGTAIVTGGSFINSVLTNPIIRGASITSSSFTGGSVGDVYMTSVEITGSSLFSNSITGSSLGTNIYTGGSYANPNISGGTINNSFITSNSVISSWTGLSTGVSIALITGTSPVYLMRAYNIDLRNTIQEGTRHYFTQNGLTKYFLSVTGASLNGANSDFYLLSRLDTGTTTYSIFGASFPISSYYYSREKSPIGFPMETNNWTLFSAGSTGSQATPVSGTVYNLGGNIVVPRGSWKLSYQAVSWCTRASTGLATMSIGLGLSTNSIDLGYMYALGSYPVNPNSTQRTTFVWTSKTPVNLSAKTTYSLNAKVNAASHDPLVIANVDEGILGMWAECDYL